MVRLPRDELVDAADLVEAARDVMKSGVGDELAGLLRELGSQVGDRNVGTLTYVELRALYLARALLVGVDLDAL